MADLMQFLREEGISASILADVERFRQRFPVADSLQRRVPAPRYLYYGKEIWEEALTALLCGENLLLAGPKATGKNVLSENLAAVFGRPSWDVSFYINTDAATLLGTDTFVNGAVSLRKGPIYQCAESGGFGILDEINMAKNESLAVLHATLDFRRAIDAAVDKNAVVQVALNGQGSVSDSMLPECFPGVVTDGAPTYDPEKAKEYLAASGLNPADCGFALICSDDTKLRAGQVIQSSLKENLGIDITLESMDLATYLDKTSAGDYQAAIGGYTSSDVLAHSMGVYHSKSIGGSNKTRLNDPEIDALIDKVKATLDPEENLKVVTELSKALNDTCTQVPIYLKNNVRAYAKGLEGFKMSPSGGMYISELSWSE